ncbi:MAG: GNAT family N-acetyltransferase [Methylococcaceae bacterium]|jgi:ribosomal protein S18 acetylase RimI-like enzyme|nr:GNAT family N-acetyltransferase [Methylococcaceae bacterium]
MTMPPRPFTELQVHLARCTLTRGLSEEEANHIGGQLAALDPWLTLGFSPSVLSGYLQRDDPALHRYAVSVDEALAGVICIRHPWLRGPYIELLGLADGFRGQGIGRALLDWVEREVHTVANNVWVAASSFNERALAVYRGAGFEPVGVIEGLVREGRDEVLLRKRLG